MVIFAIKSEEIKTDKVKAQELFKKVCNLDDSLGCDMNEELTKR